MKIKFLTLVCAVATALLLGSECRAQRLSFGTNVVDWVTLGTINAEASIAVQQHFSFHVGAEVNPWTYRKGDAERQFEARQMSFWGGFRWWPWHVYSGWWAGVDGRYSIYNIGGIIKQETEEGDAYGAGLYGGYSIMLSTVLNLDLGLGVWGGMKDYTRYSCPVCGMRTEGGKKFFYIPDARIALQFIF